MAESEISVDLRIQLDKVAADAKKAGEIVRQETSRPLTTKAAPASVEEVRAGRRLTDSQKTAMQAIIARAKEKVAKLKEIDDKAEAEAAAKAERAAERLAERTEKARLKAEAKAKRDAPKIAEQQRKDRADRIDRMANAMLPQPASQQPKAASGRSILTPVLAGIGVGSPQLAAVAGLARINPAAATVVAGLQALRAAISMTAEAADRSRQLYAKTLMSGYGLQNQTRLTSLSEIIGVGEDDLMAFGNATKFLDSKIKNAIGVIEQSNPRLTELALASGAMRKNMEALKDSIAFTLAPALEKLLGIISDWAGRVAKKFMESARVNEAMQEFGKKNGVKPEWVTNTATNKIDRHWMSGGQDVTGKVEPAFQKFLAKFQPKSEIKAPDAYMKQMTASPWERMGLVIGGAGGTNYNKMTADNTSKMNAVLHSINAGIARMGQGGNHTAASPSTP